MNTSAYVTDVKNRLNSFGFTVNDQVQLYDQPTEFVAQRPQFIWSRYSIAQIFVAVVGFNRIDWDTILHFSKSCHEYAWTSQGFPWVHASLLVPKRETLALPVVIVDETDADTINAIESVVPVYDLILRGISIPILVDVAQNEFHYSISASASRRGLQKYGAKFIELNLKIDGTKK